MFRKASGLLGTKIRLGFQSRSLSLKTIGTHNGYFHCDEALAVYLLRNTEKFSKANLVRSRDPRILSSCDAVVDVGGVFDPDNFRFDHHQKGFNEVFDESTASIKLSSAGLVYKYFGKEIIVNIAGSGLSKDEELLNLVFRKLYKRFIKPIDAMDNGIASTKSELLYVDNTGLTQRVRRLNPQWYEEKYEYMENDRFEKASLLTGTDFCQSLNELALSWVPAKEVVSKAYENRKQHHTSGKVIVLDTVCPWYDHLTALNEDASIVYVVFPSSETDWKIQAVKKIGSTYESVLPLPETWRGISKDALRKTTGVKSANFVHGSGFIGGCGNYEDAMKLADMALSAEIS